MILPIIAYGDPVLKKRCQDIDVGYPHLAHLINNMFETMHNANGIGLAAPQIGLPVRIFVIDGSILAEDEKHRDMKNFKKVFINAKMIEENGTGLRYNEGCLSIPEIREDVFRKPEIQIEYYDERFELKCEKFTGMKARIIQHEYDHTEGILFTDRMSDLKKRLLKRKLSDIAKGRIHVNYKMSFYLKNKLKM